MYNYHADTIWAINAALTGIVALTCLLIILTAALKNYFWEKRRLGLIGIKKDVYEFVLSHKNTPAVCPSFANDVTPQQFIDIRTNRRIDAAFFVTVQCFKSCLRKRGLTQLGLLSREWV